MTTTENHPESLPPYMKESMYATLPTRLTVFLRTFLPWQILRFLLINFRMIRMIQINETTHGSKSK
ncbi:MAG: hypothetical protein ACP5M4_02470 [Acidobacteriaceae bacterium]